MIDRKQRNLILIEAKNVGDEGSSARLFNDDQDEIYCLKSIDNNLNIL